MSSLSFVEPLFCRASLWLTVVSLTTFAASLSAAPIVSGTKDDGVATGTRKNRGDIITYTNQLNNTGDANATGVTFTDPTPANTTQSGVVRVTPIAFDDAYTAIGNTVFNTRYMSS